MPKLFKRSISRWLSATAFSMSHIHASGGVDTSPLRPGSSRQRRKTRPRTKSPVSCREVVDLNIGGVFFSTTAQTLTANGECAFFCRLLDDNALFAAPVDKHGRIFVDRDVGVASLPTLRARG